MRICIDMGHTPTSPGASGYLDELYCDREAGKRIIAELERRGHTVYDSTAPDYLAYPDEVNHRIAYANGLSNIDLFCSIHLNAGGGQGTEVLYYDGDYEGAEYAELMSANIAKAIGIPNRGAKPNDWVGVICNTRWTAVLVEYCFVDSEADADAWHAAPWEDIVCSLCDGIEGKEWNGPSPEPKPEPKPDPKPEPTPTDEIRYKVSTDPYGKDWLPEMVGHHDTSGSGDDFAGIMGDAIRWLAIDGVKKYRVFSWESGWLPWVYNYNDKDLDYGCAGDGSPIVGVQIKDDSARFAVHVLGAEWYDDMIGEKDTGGTSDNFGGDLANRIDAIQIRRNR